MSLLFVAGCSLMLVGVLCDDSIPSALVNGKALTTFLAALHYSRLVERFAAGSVGESMDIRLGTRRRFDIRYAKL